MQELDRRPGAGSALALLTVLLALVGCRAIDYERAHFTVDGDTATMSGVIDETTPRRVRTLFVEHPQIETLRMTNVEGSADDEANVRAARMVRAKGLTTLVPADGMIASGGTDFFLAGTRRIVEQGARIGVHSWAGIEGGEWIEGKDVPIEDPQHALYLDFYDEMDVPPDFYWFTLRAAPADGIHWMTSEELVRYSIVTE